MRASKCFILSLFLLLTIPSVSSSETMVRRGNQSQQSVGLVLSGGGAKGIAHIGVIQALEDNNIPVDYITGTSMGAIVGGLYACGYTPAEMMDLLRSEYFMAMSTGTYDPELTYYFSRPAESPQMFSIALGGDSTKTDKGFDPQSLIAPTPMAFGFMELFSSYTAQCNADFDNLFVPYRCVASNLTKRRKQVMRGGNLGDAIRSSMSFPLIFQAVEIDGDIFYDGGIFDNFPVGVMSDDFNPDIMIGVDVSSTSDGPPNTFLDQLDLLVTHPQSYDVPADKGIKMRVDLNDYGLLDFGKAEAIYERGYNKAMEMIDSIKGRVTARRDSSEVDSRRQAFKSRTPRLRISSVSVTGGTPPQNEFIESLFRPRKGTDTIGIDDARLAFYRAVSSDKISSLTPRATLSNDSLNLFDLHLNARIKKNFSIGMGGFITSSNNSYLYASAGYSSLSFTSLSLSLEAWIGQSYMAGVFAGRINLPTRVPSAFKALGVVSRRRYYENEKLFFRDNEPTFVTKHEYFGKLAWTMAAGRKGELETGIGGGRLFNSYFQNNRLSSYMAGRDHVALDLGQAFVSYSSSTLGEKNFPVSGYSLDARVAALAGKANYLHYQPDGAALEPSNSVAWLQADFKGSKYLPVSKHFVLGVEGQAVISTRKLLDDYYSTISSAPSFNPTPASDNMFDPKLRANSFAAVGVVPVYKYNSSLSARLSANVFVPARPIVETGDGGVRYGKWFGEAHFFGELDIVYHLPFVSVCGYCNYSSSQNRFNVGISLGIYIPAPSFL